MYSPIQPTLGVAADLLDGAIWHKSSYSGTQGNCVEVATNVAGVIVRDSKNPHGPKLVIEPAAWRDFMAGIRAGRYEP
jgi:hypothetical protein